MRDLSEFDVILMRQDPPFDMAYITATYFLEKLHPATLVVNNPTEVRNAPEKIFVTGFPERLLTGDRVEPAFIVTKPFDPETLKVAIVQALSFSTPHVKAG